MTNELPPYNFPRDFGTSVLSLKLFSAAAFPRFPSRKAKCSAIVGLSHAIIYLSASKFPVQVHWIFRWTAGHRLLVSFFRSTRHQGLEGHPLCNQQQHIPPTPSLCLCWCFATLHDCQAVDCSLLVSSVGRWRFLNHDGSAEMVKKCSHIWLLY